MENRESNRRSFIRKIVGIAAFGGLAGLLFGQKSEKVSAAGAANQIAYYTAPDTLTGSNHLRWYNTDRNFVAGYSGNTVTSGAVGATISGGGTSGLTNRVTDSYGTVGGGLKNLAGDNDATVTNATYATVGGGWGNTASGQFAAVGGGEINQASSTCATVGGGHYNTASGDRATVGGGYWNMASGYVATVPGGCDNVAAGYYSFAAGRRAKIAATHDGTFLFADQSNYNFNSSAANEFAVRATGGARFVTAIDPGTGNPTKTIVMTPAGNLGVGTPTPTACVHGQTSLTDGRGVYGCATASTGSTLGVYGRVDSTAGTGVSGYATAASGTTNGVYGRSDSPNGRGVYGYTTAGTGSAIGVYGQCASTSGIAIYGYASAVTGTTKGVYGRTSSPNGRGVEGLATGGGIGGRFQSDTGPAIEAQGDMLPFSDNAYDCGKDGRRWKLLRAVTVTPGDLVFENGVRATEEGEGLAFINPRGKKIAVLDDEGNLRIKGDVIKDPTL